MERCDASLQKVSSNCSFSMNDLKVDLRILFSFFEEIQNQTYRWLQQAASSDFQLRSVVGYPYLIKCTSNFSFKIPALFQQTNKFVKYSGEFLNLEWRMNTLKYL